MKNVFALCAWLALSFITAAVGAAASINARSFYAELARPAWAPPGWVFGPVWTALFVMMAVSAFLVWRRGGLAQHRVAFTVFVAQLVLNALWSWLFFGWKLGAAAMVDVVLLWALIGLTIALFWRVSKLAAALLLPYWLWVSFATALTFSVWQRNPGVL